MSKLIPNTPEREHVIDFSTYNRDEQTATCSVCGEYAPLVPPRSAKPGGPGYSRTDMICRYSLPPLEAWGA